MRHQLPVYSPLTPSAILGAVSAASRRGRRERRALEAELENRFTADSVVLTDSGTHALQIALARAPSMGEDGVIAALPGYSCYDLVTAAVGAGVRVRFYDIDPVTLAPDLDSLREVLRAGVSVVVAGNLYGYSLPWSDLSALCAEAGVPTIEDTAQGVGSMSDEGEGGTLGAATVLSFGRGKGWTGGGGGALMFRNDSFRPRRASGRPGPGPSPRESGRSLGARAAVASVAAWGLGRPALYGIPTAIPGLGLGETHYHEPSPPGGISAFSAALARRTSAASRSAVTGRRATAGRIREALGQTDSELTSCEPIGGPKASGFLRLPALAGDRAQAEAIARAGARYGVGRGYPRPLHRLPAAERITLKAPGRLPGSDALAERLVTFPTHEWVTQRDIAALGTLLRHNG